jgi:hypothetical protein
MLQARLARSGVDNHPAYRITRNRLRFHGVFRRTAAVMGAMAVMIVF